MKGGCEMKKEKLRIGFIGLGKMGSGIFSNIQKAGYDLTVYNRTWSKTQPFKERGAKVARTTKELADNSDIIFSSLLDDLSMIELCHGENGILNSTSPGKIHVGLTTIQPSTADKLQLEHEKHACHYIAAPVVGRPDAVEAGQLITFLAGEPSVISRTQSVIESYTVKQVPVGQSASAANAMKICVNYMAMAQLAMLGEIFTYAEKIQLDKSQVLSIAKMFFSGNEAMKTYAEKIAKREFDNVGFDLSAGLKDAFIFATAFNSCGVKPSAIAGATDNLVAANANGLGKKDWSALTEISRILAGLTN